jgi:hypothetical protein
MDAVGVRSSLQCGDAEWQIFSQQQTWVNSRSKAGRDSERTFARQAAESLICPWEMSGMVKVSGDWKVRTDEN